MNVTPLSSVLRLFFVNLAPYTFLSEKGGIGKNIYSCNFGAGPPQKTNKQTQKTPNKLLFCIFSYM